ncbi:hypothetical protein L9F63_012194, partial [Diploptera punctata]
GYPVFPFAILADHAIHPPPDLASSHRCLFCMISDFQLCSSYLLTVNLIRN